MGSGMLQFRYLNDEGAGGLGRSQVKALQA